MIMPLLSLLQIAAALMTLLAAQIPTALAAAVSLPPVTWISTGERPGQAILVGMPVVILGQPHFSHGQLTLPAGLQQSAASVKLDVLQQGNGTVVLALPMDYKIGHWGLRICTSDSICTPTFPIYAPDVMWASCSGVACAAGETLRLFGRRLAFDGNGCRIYSSTHELVSGTATRVRLTAPGAKASVEVEAVSQSCWEARFKLPDTLVPGSYQMEVATYLGGSLSPYIAPAQTDVHMLAIGIKSNRGETVFRPKARTEAAIVSALTAAAHSGGGVVQLSAGTYTLAASATLVIGEGCTLRGAGISRTTLKFGKQTLGTAEARQKVALIHGANTSQYWGLEDLAIVAPMSDHMNQYFGSPVVADCGRDELTLNKFGLRDDENSWACSGMAVSRVNITIDKTCAPGTAWPEQKDFLKSCGGYTAINSTEKGNTMLAGVVPAVMITGRDAVLQDSQITHYGTCGSNVAFALLVKSAANVVIQRSTITYGCAPYGFDSVDGLIFEGNELVPYKAASGGGSNIDVFGNKVQMRRLLYANNTQRLTAGVPMHLETMTLDTGAGAYEGKVSVTTNGQKLTTAGQPQFASPPDSDYRADWSDAAALLLTGPGAGQWSARPPSQPSHTPRRGAACHWSQVVPPLHCPAPLRCATAHLCAIPQPFPPAARIRTPCIQALELLLTWMRAHVRAVPTNCTLTPFEWVCGHRRRALLDGSSNNDTYLLERPFDVAPDRDTFGVIGKLEGQMLFIGNVWALSHFQLYGMCLDCVVAENLFDDCFVADWGRNPGPLVGGWQPNFQVEWIRNHVVAGTGITFMTSDQPLTCVPGPVNKYKCPVGTKINATYAGPLNNRIVVRGNVFDGGEGIQLSTQPYCADAQTNANVLVDSNVLNGTCNLTTHPMPTGADINDYLQCSVNGTCRLRDIVLHGNDLHSVKQCALTVGLK